MNIKLFLWICLRLFGTRRRVALVQFSFRIQLFVHGPFCGVPSVLSYFNIISHIAWHNHVPTALERGKNWKYEIIFCEASPDADIRFTSRRNLPHQTPKCTSPEAEKQCWCNLIKRNKWTKRYRVSDLDQQELSLNRLVLETILHCLPKITSKHEKRSSLGLVK